MFSDAYTKLDALEVEALLPLLNPLIDGSPYNPSHTVILAMELPFYPGYTLFDMADRTTLPARRTLVLYKKGAPIMLDWTNAPLYRLNDAKALQLSEKTVVAYVRFFFGVVRGRHGQFLVVENIDDISWKEEPPVAARKAIGGLIEPVRLNGVDQDGNFLLSLQMLHKDSLFKSGVHVSRGGIVTLPDQEQELVVEDIPVMDDILRA